MLWEKVSYKQKRGYLYIRETIYQRDKRTLKKSKSNLEKVSKQRWKYSKKKDIYCGKIIVIEPKEFITFKEYILKKYKEKDFTNYKLNISFENLLNDFVSYLLKIHHLKEEELYSRPKKAFNIGTGYLSNQTIEYLKRFNVRENYNLENELERFANRAFDTAIFDEEIVVLLFMKLLDDKQTNTLEKSYPQINSESFNSFKDFIKREHD